MQSQEPKTVKDKIFSYIKLRPDMTFKAKDIQEVFPEVPVTTITSTLNRLHLEGLISKPRRGEYVFPLWELKEVTDEKLIEKNKGKLNLIVYIDPNDDFLDDLDKMLAEVMTFLHNLVEINALRKEDDNQRAFEYINKISEYLFKKYQLEYLNKNVEYIVESLLDMDEKEKEEVKDYYEGFYKMILKFKGFKEKKGKVRTLIEKRKNEGKNGHKKT